MHQVSSLGDMVAASEEIRLRPCTFWQNLGGRIDAVWERLVRAPAFRKAATRFTQVVRHLDRLALDVLTTHERQVVVDEIETAIAEIEWYLTTKCQDPSCAQALPLVTAVYQLRAALERVARAPASQSTE